MIKHFLFGILLFITANVTAQQPQPVAFGQATIKVLQVGSSNKYTGSKSLSIGPDSTRTDMFASIRAITKWANDRLAELFNYVNTVDTVNTNGTLAFSAGALGVSTNRFIPVDTLETKQLKGGGALPSMSVGQGSGSTIGSTTFSNLGTDVAGEITVTASATPSLGFAIANISFTRHYSTAPFIVITPSNVNAAAISGVFISRSNDGFSLYSSITNLTSGTVYKWSYHVIQ